MNKENHTEKQFVTYEIAKQLKDLGFNEKCISWYCNKIILPVGQRVTSENNQFNTTLNSLFNDNEFITSPLWQQVEDWILVKYGLSIEYRVCNNCRFHYEILSWDNKFFGYSVCIESMDSNIIPFESKIKAREHAILETIKYVKEFKLLWKKPKK